MTGATQDLRYAARGLRKSPAFLLVAVLTLALGIGANIAVFSVMNAILLNPSGIPHADSVVALRARYSTLKDLQNISISAPDFGDAVTGKDVFTSAAVLQGQSYNYSGAGTTPERLIGAQVSWQWFDVFWASPYLGRVFRPEEDQPNANHEVVLSYRTWKRRFGGDPNIVGRSLLLNQENYQVVGVMRPDFDWPNGTELWSPIALPSGRYFDPNYRYNESLFAVARLRPGVTLEKANAYLQVRSAQSVRSEGANSYGAKSGWGMFCMPLVEFAAGNLRQPLSILLAAVATVLLIVCANIAGLLLARATGRQHEIAIQIALGAGNGRLVSQALMESLLLAVMGVGLGVLLARFAVPLLLLLAPPSLAGNLLVPMDHTVLAFVSGVGILCVLLCGTVPAWHVTHSRWFQVLQEGGRSGTSGGVRQRMRSVLVVGEIALAMLLLVGAGLLVRSLQQVERLDTGFEPRGLVSAVFSLPPAVYKSDPQQAAFLAAAENELKNIPGVKGAAIADALPFSNQGGMSSFSIKSHPASPNEPGPHGSIRLISPDYFSTLGIPLLRGRTFTTNDRQNTQPVAIIDKTLANQYWPGEDPLGQQINFGDKTPWMTIVGVVAHAKSSSLEADVVEGFYFLPLAQSPNPGGEIVVRSNSNPESLAGPIQAALRRVDPNQPIYDVKTMEQRVDDSLVGRRFLVVLLSIFAAVALLLAAVGLYGVISYSVRLRTREFGIRVALGAKRTDVLRLILGQGVRLAAIGLAIGLATTFATGRALSSLLYNVSLLNPVTLLATSALLVVTVLFASYLPAHWATRVEPMVALRDE